MNLERFKYPAIIAAGLHGALFLGLNETTPRTLFPREKLIPVWLKPMPQEPPTADPEPPEDKGTETTGSVTPLPSTPDVPHELTGRESFVVPVSSSRPNDISIARLPSTIVLGPGPGNGGLPGHWNIPSVANLDRVPRAIVQPSPDYPAEYRRDGIDGAVTVEFVVDTSGRVISAEAVKWTRREFVEPAVRAVLRWRFEPGMMDGRKVRFRMAVPIEFNPATR